jgi:hypothetical protein
MPPADADPEFGPLVHAERVRSPQFYIFAAAALLMLGVAAVVVAVAASAPPRRDGGDAWTAVAVIDGVILAFAAFFAYLMWQEFRTRVGVTWRVFRDGAEWRRGGVVRRIAFADVRQIGITQRTVVMEGGTPTSGAMVLRLAADPAARDPIELVVRFDALPGSEVSARLAAVREGLVRQVAAQMRAALARGEWVGWGGTAELTADGIVWPAGGEVVRWNQIRRLVVDAEEFRAAEEGRPRSRIKVPTTGPNFYPGLEFVMERTGLGVEAPTPR